MPCRTLVACLVASLACGAPLAAQDTPKAPVPSPVPAPSPTPAPAPAPGPEAELRATLRTLAKALQDGDRPGIAGVLYAANDTERKMVDAMAGMAAEIAGLYKASAKAFGEEQAKSLTGDLGTEMARIDGAAVKIDGDAATVRYAAATPEPATKPTTPPAPGAAPAGDEPAPSAPLVLKRVDGRWRVPVAELSKDTTPEEIEQRLGDLEAQTKVIAELAGEIAKGKYKSAEKAAEAWQAKMMQALTPPRKPEEKPAAK